MAAASTNTRLITHAGVGLVVLSLASPARAQQRPGAPVTGNEVPQGSPLPRVLPPAAPEVGPGPAVPPPAQPNGNVPNASVAITSVAVDGATAYPADRLAAITAGLQGPATPLAKVEAARLAIVNLYRRDGYVLTTVTASIGAGGQLRFVVAEGYISDVKLEGDIGPAGTQVLRFLQHLTAVRPIDTATLERWLLLAQDVPGVSVHAVLRPSGTEPSALTLIAELNRQAVNGIATFDNRGFRGTGPVQALGVLDLNSFTQFGEKTEISLYRSEGDTQTFGQVGEEFFAGGSGLKLRLYYGHGEATPYGSVVGTTYTGYTTVFGTSASYPLIRARAQTLNLAGALDAIETYTIQASPTKDSLRVGRIGIDYALEDTLLGDDRPGVNTAVVRLSRGLPFLGGSKYGNPQAQAGVAANEDYDFTKISFDASRTQTLFQPWDNATVAFKARVTGQGSASVVPPAEKFFLGGPEFNRGYYAGQVTGDSALAYTAELQLNTGFTANVFGRPIDVGTQFYMFYDYGEVWQNVKQEANPHISSEGIGTRITISRYTEFDLEGDIRNTRLPIGTASNVKPLKADAVYWRVLTRF